MANVKKPKIVSKKKETVRERAEKQRQKKTTQPRRKKVAAVTSVPLKGISKILAKEYNPIKLKKGKYSSFFSKKVPLVPKYFTSSATELRQVVWLKPKQALSLTFAVIVFSVVLALFVQLLGYGFDKLFKEVILK